MSKIDALKVLIYEAQKASPTKKGLKECRAAMTTLGLSDKDQVELEISLEFRNRNTRDLYHQLQTTKPRNAVKKFDWANPPRNTDEAAFFGPSDADSGL